MKKKLYLLLDSRAGILAANSAKDNMNDVDNNWKRYVLLASESKKEICHYANNEEYGANCIVADDSGYVYWEWYKNNKWKCK